MTTVNARLTKADKTAMDAWDWNHVVNHTTSGVSHELYWLILGASVTALYKKIPPASRNWVWSGTAI